jgi:hypothetical protein
MVDKLEGILGKLEEVDVKQWVRVGEEFTLQLNGEGYRLLKGNVVRKKWIGSENIVAGKLEVRSSNGISSYGSMYVARLDKLYERVAEYNRKEGV